MVASSSALPALAIERHRAAIARTELSRPVRLALEAGFFSPDTTFFDYGCGYGGDVQRLTEKSFLSAGWDPYYCPNTEPIPADIVNLGYVINVIENPAERRTALIAAWELTRQVLIVSAQVIIRNRGSLQLAYSDGIVTCRNTFQKYYEQEELKTYIDQVLNVDAIPVSLGIYFVFRDDEQRETFRASRFRSRATTPRIRTPSQRFEDYQELLTPLMAFITERGRLPVKGELIQEAELLAEFRSYRRAFKVILQATDKEEWEAIAQKRRQEILVYLAFHEFSQRPKYKDLSPTLRQDIKALCDNYQNACDEAEDMLFSLGDPGAIAKYCQQSPIGKKLPNALYVHISCLDRLHPLLRLYEACASRTIGRMEEATLIKFHAHKPKISYLFYPDFDSDPHPALHTSMQIDLQDLHVTYQDYDNSPNPPILHRKETFVTPEYPLYDKFAKLTQQEEKWGLLDETRTIGTRKGWEKCLATNCAEIRSHRVGWRKDTDPYRMKILQSAHRQKSKNTPVCDNINSDSDR